jgi:Domain of unknown function (DUF4214)
MRQITAFLAAFVLSIAVGGSVGAQGYGEDTAIRRAFQSVLHRDPYPAELRRYRILMEENGWREADVRRDLSGRTDYQRYSSRGRSIRPDAIVRRAYQDILGRDPDPEGLSSYRSKIIDEGWSERDVREALRNSAEYASTERRNASADRIIRRAYLDILHREPDPGGLETYRRNIVENGWDEHDVRQALLKSPEKRQSRPTIGDAEAADIVRRAYLSVLNREPDADGMRDYKLRVLRDRWSEQDVVRALRNSDEYRRMH